MTKESSSPGKVWLVGAGPGEPDLITWRGMKLLEEADVVLYDALSHPALLELCGQAELVDVGKRFGHRATPQAAITAKLVELAGTRGQKVVRLKGGDPLVFARGSEEAVALARAGIPFEIVPGVTSAIAASALAGISLTHRDLSSSVTFITGSDKSGKDWSAEAWKKLATATGTICVYMGMRRIGEITKAIVQGGRSPVTPAAVVQWGARPEQLTVVGTLEDIAEKTHAAGLTNPAIIVVGEVVALRREMNWYESKPLFGQRVLVARPRRQVQATEEALRKRGAACVAAPAIEILPPADLDRLDEALLKSATYDWVLLTSANGVNAAFSALRRLGRDARVFGNARVGAIGPKTAAELSAHGIQADLVAKEFVAEGLVEDLQNSNTPLSRVLVLRAAEAREVLPESLRAAGSEVDVVPAYRTLPVGGEAAARLREVVTNQSDVVLFTSSSMVDSVIAALGDDAVELLAQRVVACIGPVTTSTARNHGLRVDCEATQYTVEGVLDALERHFSS